MTSIALVPFCPLPPDTGGKIEMWKHLETLRELGPCTILSAASKPVGGGWTAERKQAVESRGFRVVLRESAIPRRNLKHYAGISFAALCKTLRFEKAFGHSNPYHRYAFPRDWWYRHTQDADLALIHYSYWAWLPCACPKAIALLDLWSDYMWEGPRRETDELKSADLVTVISIQEEQKLRQRGLQNTLWSPPAVTAVELADSARVGLLGSPSPVNREGLRWLGKARSDIEIHVFGGLANDVPAKNFHSVGRYRHGMDPYRHCGIILLTTARGMGVQIKAIEALACGRAIVARRGAMRGLPAGHGAWIEVGSAHEMLRAASRLQADREARLRQMQAAKSYYRKYLDSQRVRSELLQAYGSLVNVHGKTGAVRR